MIRGYFLVSKCVKNLHGLRRTERATGVLSSIKNYSVSAKSEAESKTKNEAEEEELHRDKGLLSAALANLKEDEDVNKDQVKKSQNVKKELNVVNVSRTAKVNFPQTARSKIDEGELEEEITVSDDKTPQTTAKGFADDLNRLKTILANRQSPDNNDELTEKLKKVVSTLQEKIGQPPPLVDKNIKVLHEKVTDYITNAQTNKTRKKYETIQESGYLLKLEQAAKQGKNLSVSEMITALKSMVESRTRPEPFLKLLASRLMNQDNLDVKECSDILYALAGLHYRDENLIAKITENVCLQMDTFKNASVVNCILRSYAMLSYRDPTIISILIDWIAKNKKACKDHFISNAIMSLAILNYFPDEAKNLVEEFSQKLNLRDSPDTITFLDNVWSLVLLNCATHEQVNEVLSPDFVGKLKTLESNEIGFSRALKLLNIKGYASNILKDYKGSMLTNSIRDIVPSPKYKATLIASVIDALLNLMPSADYVVTNVNTRCGFVIDAEFFVDANGKPLPYVIKTNRSGLKVAVLVLGYFDLCYGAVPAPMGPVALSQRILEAKGYKVLTVTYTDFPPNKRLIEKAQFLESKIKALAAS